MVQTGEFVSRLYTVKEHSSIVLSSPAVFTCCLLDPIDQVDFLCANEAKRIPPLQSSNASCKSRWIYAD